MNSQEDKIRQVLQDFERFLKIEAAVQETSQEPPAFRVNTEDVAFLRSVGIDPTRTVRRRRSNRR